MIRHAYGFDRMSLDGAGQEIVIVGAGLPPALAADVAVFDRAMGLPACQLRLTQTGPIGTVDPGWMLEDTLDVE